MVKEGDFHDWTWPEKEIFYKERYPGSAGNGAHVG
jgi:hypothetical protein